MVVIKPSISRYIIACLSLILILSCKNKPDNLRESSSLRGPNSLCPADRVSVKGWIPVQTKDGRIQFLLPPSYVRSNNPHLIDV